MGVWEERHITVGGWEEQYEMNARQQQQVLIDIKPKAGSKKVMKRADLEKHKKHSVGS